MTQSESICSGGVVCRRCGPHHRVVLPGENGQAVLVLAELLLDLGPHAFGLALQRDEDDGMATQLNQVQEALPGSSTRAHMHSTAGDGNTDLMWQSAGAALRAFNPFLT